MREIIARTKPLTSFRGPAESIAGSQKEDADIRSLCDEDIRGKVIRNVSWSDNRFVLEFDDGFYLNITAQRDGISCSLDTTPILPDLAIESDTEIVLNLDGFVRASLLIQFFTALVNLLSIN